MSPATPFNLCRGHHDHLTPPAHNLCLRSDMRIPSFRSGGLCFVSRKPTVVGSPFAEGQYEPYHTKSGKVHSNLGHDSFGAEITQSMHWLRYGLNDKISGFDSPVKARAQIALVSTISRLVLGPIQPLVQWNLEFLPLQEVKRLGRDHSHPSAAEDNNAWSYIIIFS
jgi:hypothetical protein